MPGDGQGVSLLICLRLSNHRHRMFQLHHVLLTQVSGNVVERRQIVMFGET